jgi:hypothetical protein
MPRKRNYRKEYDDYQGLPEQRNEELNETGTDELPNGRAESTRATVEKSTISAATGLAPSPAFQPKSFPNTLIAFVNQKGKDNNGRSSD